MPPRVRRGRRARKIGSRLPEVVVRENGSLAEQQVDPQRRGDEPIWCGVARIERDCGSECRERFIVIEVVSEVQGARTNCGGPRGRRLDDRLRAGRASREDGRKNRTRDDCRTRLAYPIHAAATVGRARQQRREAWLRKR